MPAEMRRIAVLSLEPDPGNAGVGMRYTVGFFFYRIATPHGSPCGIFYAKISVLSFFRGKETKMKKIQTKALCEGAIMVALATVLSFIKFFELPQGGSVCIGKLHVIF